MNFCVLFLLYSRDHPPIFGRIVSPPGVEDDDDDDAAKEVQTDICCLTKFYDARENIIIHPASSIILITTKPYQIWYTPLHVGVVATNRREYQRNHINMLLGL